jgi:hypothetical protein
LKRSCVRERGSYGGALTAAFIGRADSGEGSKLARAALGEGEEGGAENEVDREERSARRI